MYVYSTETDSSIAYFSTLESAYRCYKHAKCNRKITKLKYVKFLDSILVMWVKNDNGIKEFYKKGERLWDL